MKNRFLLEENNTQFMIDIIIAFLYLLNLAIFARVVMSWVIPSGQSSNPLVNIIHEITEPILSPIRKIVPRVGMFDFTPMIAVVTLGIIISVLGG